MHPFNTHNESIHVKRQLICHHLNYRPATSLDNPKSITDDYAVQTTITQDAIQSMLWFPYKGLQKKWKTSTICASDYYKSSVSKQQQQHQQQPTKKFQPIVQVVSIRTIRNTIDENSGMQSWANVQGDDDAESIVLILSDSVLSVEAVIVGKASSCLQTLQPGMFIQVLEYQRVVCNAINDQFDSSFTIRVSSFRIINKERPFHTFTKTRMTVQHLFEDVLDQVPNQQQQIQIQQQEQQLQQQHQQHLALVEVENGEELEKFEGTVGQPINVNIQCQVDIKFVGLVTELGMHQETSVRSFLGLFGGVNMRYDGALILANAICKSSNPRVISDLHLRDNDLGDNGTRLLIDACRTVSCPLKFLDLCNNNITDVGLQSVLQLLQPEENNNDPNNSKNVCLQSLYLDGNNFSPTGITAFAASLSTNTSLIELSFGNNNIGDDGVIAIATALPKTTVETLRIHSNNIGTVGITFLADVVKYNTTLRELDMRHNAYEDNGALAMYSAMQYSNSIVTLRFAADTIIPRVNDQNNIDYNDKDGASDKELYDPVMVLQILSIFEYNNKLLIVDDPKLPRWIRTNVLTNQRYNRNDRAGPDRYVRPYPPPKLGLTPRNDIYQWLLLHP